MDRKYGSMNYPDYIDSLSAFFIIYKAFDLPNLVSWKKYYYLIIFLINGISSCLAHSPLIAKYLPNFSYLMDQIDLYSIAITLVISPMFVSKMYILVKLFLILFNLFGSLNLIHGNIVDVYTGFFIYPVITIIGILYAYNLLDVNVVLLACSALFFKLNQKRFLFHSIWHILGTLLIRIVYIKLASN